MKVNNHISRGKGRSLSPVDPTIPHAQRTKGAIESKWLSCGDNGEGEMVLNIHNF
jgi:hypothetical protein